MREARRIPGARALLFDRLVDDDRTSDEEEEPVRTLDREALRRSVRVELERLLNTRSPLRADELAERPRTTLEYGLPDLAHLYTRDPAAHAAAAAAVKEAVEAYEPRLRQVRASVEPSPTDDGERRLLARIDAFLVAGEVMEAVSFVRIPIGGTEGRA
jgi:type VI secretion system lysozyme-like protein